MKIDCLNKGPRLSPAALGARPGRASVPKVLRLFGGGAENPRAHDIPIAFFLTYGLRDIVPAYSCMITLTLSTLFLSVAFLDSTLTRTSTFRAYLTGGFPSRFPLDQRREGGNQVNALVFCGQCFIPMKSCLGSRVRYPWPAGSLYLSHSYLKITCQSRQTASRWHF